MCDIVTINGVSCATVGLEVINTIRPLTGETKTQFVDVPHRDGAVEIYDDTEYDVTVTVTFMLKPLLGVGFYDQLRLIQDWIITRYKEDIVFDDDPRYAWHGKVVNSITYEQIVNYATFDAEFRCDPRPRPLGGGA